MATLQTITIDKDALEWNKLPMFHYFFGDNVIKFFDGLFGEAAYPDVHPDHLLVKFDRRKVSEAIDAIYSDALTASLYNTNEIVSIAAHVSGQCVDGRNAFGLQSITLETHEPMNEDAAISTLQHVIDRDNAMLLIERDVEGLAHGTYAKWMQPQVDIHPISKAWHDMKRDNPDSFYEIATAAYKHYGKKLWMGAWDHCRSEVENFLHWVMKNHPNIELFTQEIGMNPDPAALPAAPTATNEPTANTNNQTTTPTPMAKTANPSIPQGYKVAPAADPTNAEAIASQFATQFEKALSAVSPSGAKLADCELVWSATTRPNDLPGRIITCKVVENEQTWHTFTFDCKDRHRDSTTYDEGMKFDWLSVDAMIKAFTGQASVLDCVKEGCKKRLMGPAAAPAPKAATKTEPTAAPQPAAPAAPQPAEGVPTPTEATTPAPMPKANTKTAPMAQPQSNEEGVKSNVAPPQTPQTPSVFQTYECSQTPAFYYHLYGEGENSGIVVIHRETGDIRQHCKNQTMESSRALIKQHGMTEVQPIPTVVITALIKEGVIKAPLSINNEKLTINNDQADEKAAAEKAAAEQREREEREAAERAEQERIEREKREAEERKRKEAEAKAKREEEERKRKEAEEEAKRKAEEEEAKKRIEEEKQKIAKRNATMTIRHRDYDKIRIEVELQPLTRTGNYFWGDAGTGKTHMAKMLADDLGLKFYYQGVVQAIHDFKGMVDGHGRFHATAAYYAATQGGLLLLDEMDRYPEDALIWLNGLIANRYASFYVWDEELQCVSEQTITAHPDFRVIGTGNTNGEGPTPLYTAAVQLDASTLDRFNFTHVDYDERVELAIAEGDGELVEFIEAFRATVRDCRFNNLVTYRAVETIHVYMKDGRISIKDALTDRIVKGMSTENQRFVANRLGDHVNVERNKYAKAYCELANENYRSAASKVA